MVIKIWAAIFLTNYWYFINSHPNKDTQQDNMSKSVEHSSFSSYTGTRDYDDSDINFEAMYHGEGKHLVPGKGYVQLQAGWATVEDEDGCYFYNEATGEEREEAPIKPRAPPIGVLTSPQCQCGS